MDPSWLALAVFLVLAVGVAAVMLWPRFRESVKVDDPVVPEIVHRLREELEGAVEGVEADLRRALDHDPVAVRASREAWKRRLKEAGAAGEILDALDKL